MLAYPLCGLLILLGVANIVVYVRYAQANYPQSRRWEYMLIGVPFLLGSAIGAVLAGKDFPSVFFVLFVLGNGAAFAFLYRCLYVQNMQHVMPKRVTPRDRKEK